LGQVSAVPRYRGAAESRGQGVEPRCFGLFVQWLPGDIIRQEDGLTWEEAWDGFQGMRSAARPPHRVAMALVVPR